MIREDVAHKPKKYASPHQYFDLTYSCLPQNAIFWSLPKGKARYTREISNGPCLQGLREADVDEMIINVEVYIEEESLTTMI